MKHTLYNIIYALLLSLTIATSCSDDIAELTAPTAPVQKQEAWTDLRDGHTYGVVRIGNQEWTTENLAYYLPTGTAGGCFTWGEKEGDYKLEDVTFLPDTVQINLTTEQYAGIYEATANDPAHDWQAEDSVSPEQLMSFLTNYFELYGEEAFTKTMAYYPHFHAALVAALEAGREGMRDEVVAALAAKYRAICTTHRDKAEATNGNYSRTYGYLYSLDGARAAVPATGGWRLPTDADWMQLEASLGMTTTDQQQLNAWRGQGAAPMLLPGGAAGFNALYAGCNAYLRTNEMQYIRQGQCAYFWANDESTSTEQQEVTSSDGETSIETLIYRVGIVRQLAAYDRGIWRGTTRTDNHYRSTTYSVRLVRDLQAPAPK